MFLDLIVHKMYSTYFKFRGVVLEYLLNQYWHLSRELKRKQPKLEKRGSQPRAVPPHSKRVITDPAELHELLPQSLKRSSLPASLFPLLSILATGGHKERSLWNENSSQPTS